MKSTIPARERRRWPVGVDPRREARREGAALRKLAREGRTDDAQLNILRARTGHSAKEIRRLMKPGGEK